MPRFLIVFFLLVVTGFADVAGQTVMPLPPHVFVQGNNVRGYWFTAPVDMTIVGVRVPTDANTSPQSAAILRLHSVPPLYLGGTTNNFTVEALFRNRIGFNILPVHVQVAAGEMIGVLGNRNDENSAAIHGIHTTTIAGNTVTLTRLGMSYPISTTNPQDIWQDPVLNINRVELYYVICNGPYPQIMSMTGVECNGDSTGSAIGGATGGVPPYTYQWSNGDSGSVASNLTGGPVTLTIRDSLTCESDTTFMISTPDTIRGTFATTDNTCFGEEQGEATVTTTGGIPPYAYNWSTGGTAGTETNMPSGQHTVAITDSNGCVVTYTTSISSPDSFYIQVDSVTNTMCENSSDGSIQTTTDGGVFPYVFAWDDPDNQFSETAVNLLPGLYSIQATDANGCVVNATANVGFHYDSASIELGPDGQAGGEVFYDIFAPVGFSGYAWSNGANTPSIRVFQNGTYLLTVTDDNGCTGTDKINITGILPTGVDQLDDEVSLLLYPNPTHSILNLDVKGWPGDQLNVQITTIGGQVVAQHQFQGLASNFRQTINLAALASGLYFVKFAGEGGTAVRKIQLE